MRGINAMKRKNESLGTESDNIEFEEIETESRGFILKNL